MTASEPAGPDPGAGIVILGGGAVGTFVAALLARRRERVTLVDRQGTARGRAEVAVRAPGSELLRATVERTDGTGGLDRPAYVVLAVKMPDLDAAIAACSGWPDVALVTLENGIGAEHMVATARPGAPLLAGSLTAPVEREADGTLAWRKRRGLALGRVQGDTRLVEAAIRGALGANGLPTAIVGDWQSMKWSKLLTNIIANAVPALLDRDAAAVYADRRLFAVERAAFLEALGVMRALGLAPIRLPGADVRWLAAGYRAPAAIGYPVLRRVVGGARGGKAPSLLLHLRGGGGPSESAWLNGGVARAGAAAGVPTPVNRALADLLEDAAADPTAWERTRDRPVALLAAIADRSATWRNP